MTRASDSTSAQTLSQRLAKYIHEERLHNIDPAAVQRAKHVIAYHVGLAFRALKNSDRDAMQAIAIAKELSEDCGSSTMIGLPHKATIVDAAFANCTMMRSFGMDDVIFPAGLHPGLVTLPVALSVAEREHASGADLLTAIVVAYEILGKFGRWTWALDTPRRATMPFGPFGGIAAACILMHLPHEKIANAMGYAAHTAMGVAEGDSGPITHYYSMVCRNSIAGAYVARAGGGSSPLVLEGRFGFLESFFSTADLDYDNLLDCLGHDYMILSSCEKRYPGTALNQVPIELMRELVREEKIDAGDLETLHLKLPIERQKFAAGHELGPFTSRSTATSSVAFQVALLLLDGDLRPERYDDYQNSDILDIVRKVTVEFVTGKPVRYAHFMLRTKAGKIFVREGEDFMFPPEPNDVIMEREAGGILSARKIARFVELLENLEDLVDVADLMKCLVP